MKTFPLIVLAIAAYYICIQAAGLELALMADFRGAMVFIFIPLFFIPLIIAGIQGSREAAATMRKCIAELAEQGFTTTHKIHRGENAIFADGNASKLCIAKFPVRTPNLYTTSTYSSGQILSSKVIVDGQETTSASNSSVVGRALVGGLLFGGVGAIIGGVTAGTKSSQKIKSLELRVLVDGDSASSHRIAFFNSPSGEAPDSVEVKKQLAEIEIWQVIVELLMMGEKIPSIESSQKFQDHVEALRIKKSRAALATS